MIEFDIATLSELRAEDALQDYYDNIAEELKIADDPGLVEPDGPVYYGDLEALSHQELVYKYQQLSIEFEELTNVRN